MVELKRDIYEKLLEWKKMNSGRMLELRGARQVGKTFVLDKFARENYKKYLYIDMARLEGADFLKCLQKAKEDKAKEDKAKEAKTKDDKVNDNKEKDILVRALELLKMGFSDSSKTIVVIDEIQKSGELFSLIKRCAPELKSRFIVTGSCFWEDQDIEKSREVSDSEILTLSPLSFDEFLDTFGKKELYEQRNFYQDNIDTVDNEISKYYELYCKIGGYPSVVMKYHEKSSIEECNKEIKRIIHIFTEEIKFHCEEIGDIIPVEKTILMLATVKVMCRTEYMDTALPECVSNQIRAVGDIDKVNAIISCLQKAKILDFNNEENKVGDEKSLVNKKFYFCDMGVYHHFLNIAGVEQNIKEVVLNENFNVIRECYVNFLALELYKKMRPQKWLFRSYIEYIRYIEEPKTISYVFLDKFYEMLRERTEELNVKGKLSENSKVARPSEEFRVIWESFIYYMRNVNRYQVDYEYDIPEDILKIEIVNSIHFQLLYLLCNVCDLPAVIKLVNSGQKERIEKMNKFIGKSGLCGKSYSWKKILTYVMQRYLEWGDSSSYVLNHEVDFPMAYTVIEECRRLGSERYYELKLGVDLVKAIEYPYIRNFVFNKLISGGGIFEWATKYNQKRIREINEFIAYASEELYNLILRIYYNPILHEENYDNFSMQQNLCNMEKYFYQAKKELNEQEKEIIKYQKIKKGDLTRTEQDKFNLIL